MNHAQGSLLCVCIQLPNSSFTPSHPIGQRRVLVLEAAVVPVQLEDPTAHYVTVVSPHTMHPDWEYSTSISELSLTSGIISAILTNT
jgi:hypothetical protein